ncbi:hypothetical protein [Paraburkholderia kururiensis]
MRLTTRNESAYGATASSDSAIAIGRAALAQNGQAVSIGVANTASGNGAVAIGDPNVATGTGAVALGANSVANEANTVSVGSTGNTRRSTWLQRPHYGEPEIKGGVLRRLDLRGRCQLSVVVQSYRGPGE